MGERSVKNGDFSEQKLALLASLLEEEGLPQAPALRRIPRLGELPLSSAQMRLWLFDQLEPGSAAYNIPVQYEFKGHFDLAAFERSLTEIVRRHEVLRTCYLRVDGRPIQKIASPEPFRIPVVDLQDLPEAIRKQELARLALLDAGLPFDLGKVPLMRAQLLELGRGEQVLMLNFHHIAFDWWSFGVFEKELAVLYDHYLSGEEASPLPELPIQYADFAAWHREWLQGGILEEQLEYWRRKSSGPLPVLELPTDHPRPPVQTYNGSLLSRTLSKKLTEDVKTLSQREGVTLFTTLLAAFQVLLHRYAGQDDVLVGVPIAGRSRAETEGLVGFFVNTLVMRTDLTGDPTFRQLLRRVQETTLGAYAHQDVPFERLVETLNPERDASHSPMFQVMLSMLNTPVQPSPLRGLQHERTFTDGGTSKFELTLYVMEESRGLAFTCEYNTDLFNADRIERMLGHLQVLLENVVGNLEQHVSALPILPASEREQLLEEWNDTAVAPAEPGLCLPEMIAAQARQNPDQVALICEAQQFSYGELERRSNQLAHQLRALGVGPEVLVGLCVERSLDMVVGLLGILKAGGAYVPLDPSFPQARLAYMIADSGMRVLVTHRQLEEKLPVRPASILHLDADWDTIAQQDTTAAELPPAQPENLAYVLYTSGSTGKPKGVEIAHAALANFLRSMQQEPGFTAQDRLLAVTTLSFDIAGLELYLPLVTGGTTIIASREDNYDPARLMARLRDSRCTVMQATPATWRALLEAGWEGAKDLKILCGGEALPSDLAQALLPRCTQLWNLYGPTETTIWSTLHRVTTADGPVPIGRPIANTQVFILDGHRQLVPAGIVGELYIGGAGLARGYFARPELTAERFIENPFAPHTRLYRTGDLARWLPDGNIECLGRADHQVKIRGFRIEPGEVEAALARHPAVGQCVVVAREDSHGDKILVAYLEPQPNAAIPAVSDLRAHLANDLPAYMVPSAFVVLDKLPLTPNAKIDRKALPPPTYDRVQAAHESAAPRTENEQAVAAIWSEVLKVGGIGLEDNFFDLGGHSLLVIRAVSRIRDVFEVDLPPSTFFAHATVAGLARVLAEAKGRSGGMQRIERRSQDGPCPLSYAQERLWFLDQLAPGSPVYNIVDVVQFDGNYNADAMQRTVHELVRRHEPLRTAFSNRDGQPVQIVFPTVELAFSELDLRALPEKEREDTWIRLVREEGRKPFQLTQPPLLRGTLVHWSEQQQRLVLTLHHIIADEWSMEVLQRELHQIYRSFSQAEPSPLSELPIRYTDFVHWQRGYLQGEVLQQQVAFWKEALAGAPTVLELPTDKPRPAVQSFQGAIEAFALPQELLERLKRLSRQQDATLFMTLAAAFLVLLHRYTGQEDILLGTPISGRTRSETEDLIGLFLNLVVLRGQFREQESFQSLLEQVRQRALGAYGHQDLPFEQLVSELAPERDLSRAPLFQVMFVLFSTDAASQTSDVAALSQLSTGTSKFDLTLAVSETAAGLQGLIEYRSDLFEADTIRRLCGHYGTLLEAITQDPEQHVSALPILPASEREQLLEEWNDTAVAPAEPGLCLPEMIAAQARQNPDQVALICEAQQFSYGELERRSNQLAHQLRALGVGPEVLVGLCVERSLDMVVGLLGILKAGGAYVPLDPSFPQARLAYMIADSGMRVLVTHRQLEEKLPVRPASILHLDADWDTIAQQDTTAAELPPAQPENLAYVLYTSGSTGKPKGVEIAHAALANFLRSMQREPGFTAQDRLLAVTTLSFDIAGLELYLPLVTGGTTIIASREDNYDPARLMARLRDSRCTVMQATPATWRALLEAGWEGAKDLKVLCGGEALPSDLAQALLPRCAQLWNLYGPTETTIWSTLHRVTTADGPVPIGRPIANTQVFILDGHRQLVPAGIVGELYIGGAGLARGYFARPELTAERFIENPFAPHTRLYRTGDLARWLPDGNIECLGRADHQVKIRGFRIEPGEVEAALARHPAVGQCVVVAREDSHGDKILVAYLEPQPNAAIPAVSDLRAHLANDLPAYMVPSAFVVLDKLPLTPNAKIDRKALPPPTYDRVQAAHESAAPRTENEQAVAAIWSEVLKVGGIGLEDNFFDLGGHSLLVIRAVSRIRDVFEVDLPPSTFFAHPTVAGLARVLAEAKGRSGGMQRIERRSQDGPCPLSYAQERLWFLDQLAPGSPVYNIVDVVQFDGNYNADAMQRTVHELVRRHEPLRTAFSNRDGQPVQIVFPTVELAFSELDLRALPEKEREDTWIRLVREEGRKPFQLTQPPLLRGTLVHWSEQQQRLVLTLHHIIADEWSMEVLQRELHQIYRSFSQAEPSPLPELPIRYTDFVHWQRGYLQGEVLQQQVAFWKEALAGAPTVLELPTDKPRPAVQSFQGAIEAFALPQELLERLKRLSRQQDATLFMTLAAAFLVLLHRYTGQEDILLGTPISGRTRSETEDLIGLFLNLVVLRGQFREQESFQSLLEQVRQRALGAYGHQDLPFEQLVSELAPERDLSRAPLFQVMFVLFSTDAASQTSDVAALSQL